MRIWDVTENGEPGEDAELRPRRRRRYPGRTSCSVLARPAAILFSATRPYRLPEESKRYPVLLFPDIPVIFATTGAGRTCELLVHIRHRSPGVVNRDRGDTTEPDDQEQRCSISARTASVSDTCERR